MPGATSSVHAVEWQWPAAYLPPCATLVMFAAALACPAAHAHHTLPACPLARQGHRASVLFAMLGHTLVFEALRDAEEYKEFLSQASKI